MNSIISEYNLFKSKPSKAKTKADITDLAARSIVGAEAERREAKTARLRQMRLEAEAKQAVAQTSAGQRRAKPAQPRRARSSS
ncbi:hypothetical protein [Mesorhizobium xinjiangense]|uniref:hypothetical protein n=1 Tax=Mesorhizobium xinjiangense TaxID=2678685 RepID=UPI0012ECEFDE|nr:hypothetical protein [Mesorhizobium xinjiangense]